MISRFAVDGLHGNDAWSFDLALHKDINVFTGKNGAGKTTVLKLLWFLISGNIERVFPEMYFRRAQVEGDGFKLDIETSKTTDGKDVEAKVTWNVGGSSQAIEVSPRSFLSREPFLAVDLDIATATGSSVFFPTFRRIEGGFSLASPRARRSIQRRGFLQDGMLELAEELTNLGHQFVASIATDDIEQLLTAQVARNSEATNALQSELIKFIGETMAGWNQLDSAEEGGGVKQAKEILSSIQDKVKETEEARDNLMRPFTVLSGLIREVLKHKGIRLKNVFTFGDSPNPIEAAHLSAGEKQMFSFLYYNAFKKGSSIFIDEPEISLHVDWQRVLFPKLMEQTSNNQFIISTHSPFIYSKYPDKEWRLDADRGMEDDSTET